MLLLHAGIITERRVTVAPRAQWKVAAQQRREPQPLPMTPLRDARSTRSNTTGILRLVAQNQQPVRNVQASMRRAMSLLVAAAIGGACDSASTDDRAEASSVAMPTSLLTTMASTSVPRTTPVTVTTQPMSSASAVADAAAPGEADVVVAALIHRLYRASGMPDPPTVDRVNLLGRYGRQASGGYLIADGSVISEDVRVAVEEALRPSAVTWVSDSNVVIEDLTSAEDSTHPEVELLVTIGVPVIVEHGATILVDVVCGILCGSGETYTLNWSEREGWTVTDAIRGWVA
jgi:hypothetical protein